jgi:hypothetical protein
MLPLIDGRVVLRRTNAPPINDPNDPRGKDNCLQDANQPGKGQSGLGAFEQDVPKGMDEDCSDAIAKTVGLILAQSQGSWFPVAGGTRNIYRTIYFDFVGDLRADRLPFALLIPLIFYSPCRTSLSSITSFISTPDRRSSISRLEY